MSQPVLEKKVHLHYGDYLSKLVRFESQKIFSMLKKALA